MSKVEIKNTVCFDFGDGCARPTLDEMANFVKTLDVDAAEIEAAYRISEEKAVFIKCKSEESMMHVLRNNSEELVFRYADGKAVNVRMSPAGGNIQYVRIYDLPPELPDYDLALVMRKYGRVKRVVREKFPAELRLDMHTGVRGVYMDVKMEIPPSLNFLNRKGNIFYDGIKDKCFLCKMEGHRMKSCPKRKTRKQTEKRQEQDEVNQQQEEAHNSTSYAGVVTGGLPLDSTSNEAEDVVEVLEEEKVMEMEDVATPEPASNNEKMTTKEEGQVQQRMIKFRNEESYKKALEQWKQQQKLNAEEAKRLADEKQKKKELRAQRKAEAEGKSPPRKNKKNFPEVYSDISSE